MKINRTRGALYSLCILRAGYRNGAHLIEFIEEWSRAVEHHGGSITIEQFIRWTHRYSRRVAYSRLALFRATFPQLGEHGLPDGLMGPLLMRLAAEAEPADVDTKATASAPLVTS